MSYHLNQSKNQKTWTQHLRQYLSKNATPYTGAHGEKIEIYFLNSEKESIAQFFKDEITKLQNYLGLISTAKSNTNIYKHEQTIKTQPLTQIYAIRFKFKDNNPRIYCLQITIKQKIYIILCALLRSKKTQKHNHIQKQLFKKIENLTKEIIL